MRAPAIGLLVLTAAAASALGQQALVCPPPATPAARACDTFHYHVQLYRPDTRGFIELYGINGFATMSACDQARDAAVRRNQAIVDVYRKRGDQRYQPDRFGPCHCDTSNLNDVARNAQFRLYGETKMRVRERLMDAEVPTDSELMRGADAPLASSGPRLVPLPATTPATATSPADLKMPKSAELEAPAMSDLPWVEIAPSPAPASPAVPTVEVKADDAADEFISAETDRIQKVIIASSALGDVKIFEACSKRLQLLSNLRALIESSKGRLAEAARAAHSESDRLALVAKLFGSDMLSHWAPKEPRDVVVELVPNPETLLRDPSASSDAKGRALYSYLASVPTVEEWVASTVEAAFAGNDVEPAFKRKDYNAAYAQLVEADQLQPDLPAVLYDMALTLAKAGRITEAQSKIDRYKQLYPTGAEMPLIAKLQIDVDAARELQKKRDAEQQYAELFDRGRFLYQKGDLDAALLVFQDAEQQRPSEAAALFNQAVVYESRGDLAKAAELFHKAGDEERAAALEHELADRKTKIVCPFCGLRLPIGAMWCPRCWHGPYAVARSCGAARTALYADGRVAKSDIVDCPADDLRYTAAKQKAIQNARKAEGWTYDGEIIGGNGFVQGPDTLEKIGVLTVSAHKAGEVWLLDREELVIDGQKVASRYTYDAQNRIARQEVSYVNAAACGHLIDMTADVAPAGVAFHGGYDGFTTEGAPHVEWQAMLAKNELAVTSFTKEYTQKPQGRERDEIAGLYPTMRVRRPIENVARAGDLCAKSGTTLIGNAIDLRPFYAIAPEFAIVLPFGVTKIVLTPAR